MPNEWAYAWCRCPTCQTRVHRKVRAPGHTVRKCNVCGHTFVVAVTIGVRGPHVVISPLKGT